MQPFTCLWSSPQFCTRNGEGVQKKGKERKKEFSIGGKVNAGSRLEGQKRHFSKREKTRTNMLETVAISLKSPWPRREEQQSCDRCTIAHHMTGQMEALTGSGNNSFQKKQKT